jgi:hypothetical protein
MVVLVIIQIPAAVEEEELAVLEALHLLVKQVPAVLVVHLQ